MRNKYINLKIINNAVFSIVDIFPDFNIRSIILVFDAIFYLALLLVIFLYSNVFNDVAIPGLFLNIILIRNRIMVIPKKLRV